MGLRGFRAIAAAALVLAALVGPSSGIAAAAGAVASESGSFADGATFLIEKPANWNGTLVLYSHGYVTPGSPNPAHDVGDPATGAYLLQHGFALAGSSYATTGWAVKDALVDQIAVLDRFAADFGAPSRTIAWGHSLGGMITAGLIQRNPERFTAALPMCGVLAGGVAVWNSGLDGEFVFKTLLAPTLPLQLVHIAHPGQNLGLAETVLGQAQATPQGRARIALTAAIADLPGWFSAATPEPAANDFATRETNQFLWDQQVDFPFLFALRAELEARAGGNPSWNTGVDYARLLRQSINRDEVTALYNAAGLDLDADLATLAATPRISADPHAVDYLIQNIVFNGQVDLPVLTLHTTGDGLVLNQDEQAYARIFDERELLRQTFVHRAGHCTFTPAETVAAFNALVNRLDTGRWSGVGPQALNAAAAALGPLNVVPPAFIPFRPTRFPRPFSVEDNDN